MLSSVALLSACHHDDDTGAYVPPPNLVTDERVAYTDGLHNENTDLLALDDRLLLIFRGGETGQIGSNAAHINVYASTDSGQSWEKQSEVDASGLGDDRDIRDPKLVTFDDRLFLYATSRLPGGHYRDLAGEAWLLRSESTDGGETWTDPEKSFADLDEDGDETFWDFWRFVERPSTHTLYALGYADGDAQVAMFASDDGVDWRKVSVVVDSYDDVPSEAELRFYGDGDATAVALVRMDNQGILEDGQTAICTSQDPFTSWECGRRIEQRLDGPYWFSGDVAGQHRELVVARKHLPCTYKRTALYELRGDLADPQGAVQVCELEELPSAGDTAYTGLAPLGGDRYLTSWYSSTIPAEGDVSWLEGTFTASDIWVADLDFSELPDACNPPPVDAECPAAPLPPSAGALASGRYLLTVAPVIYPAQTLTFDASLAVDGDAATLTMQPLDAGTLVADGDPWTSATGAIDDQGVLTVTFGTVGLPELAMPLLADPYLTLHDLEFTMVSTGDGFCGGLSGYAQVVGASEADRIDLVGSTAGAAAIRGDELPSPVVACP